MKLQYMIKRLLTILLLVLILFPLQAKKDKKSADNQSFDAMKHVEVYNSVLRELEINYVDTLKHDKLLKLSLDRMLYGLDPYTSFIPASDDETLKRLRSGQYGGIGSIITLVDGKPHLSDPYYGMPAQANGLRAGDEIIEIDGVKCEGKSISELITILNKQSGYFGISGISNDGRDLTAGLKAGNERCKLAFDIGAKRIVDYIASYYVYMGGCDAICFTAGMGENLGHFRKNICDRLACLGVELDEQLNDTLSDERLISTPNSKVKVYIVPTNEEVMIARDVVRLTK